MNDDRGTNMIRSTARGINDLIRPVDDSPNPSVTSPTSSSPRTFSPPFMGTSAWAAQRRMDSDSGPIRIDGTDTFNQSAQQNLYQNVQRTPDDQPASPASPVEASKQSKQSFNAKRDFFEQRSKPPTYTSDSPTRQQKPAQKIITTITTTTTTSADNKNDSTSSSSNGSPPNVDRVLEQAVELQKLSHVKSDKKEVQQPLIIERTEQYQVFLDSTNHEIHRTPSVSRVTIVPITKTGHATDLDQAQAQANLLADDHQAIRQLTRSLQDQNTPTTTEFKRVPPPSSPILLNRKITTTTTTTTVPSSSSVARTSKSAAKEFAVIDALLDNPVATTDEKHNATLHARVSRIVSNLQNVDYVNTLRQSTKKKAAKKSSTDTIQQAAITPLVSEQNGVGQRLAQHSPLLYANERGRPDEDTRNRARQPTKNGDYRVIEAVVNSPISLNLQNAYAARYQVHPSTSPLTSPPTNPFQTVQSYRAPWSQPLERKNVNGTVSQPVSSNASVNPASPSQRAPAYANQPEPVRPRVIYRYIDEQGRLLKMSAVPPSQLRESGREEQVIPWQQNSYENTVASPLMRAVPVSIEREYTTRPSSQPPRTYPSSYQQSTKLDRAPLSYQSDQQHLANTQTGYDTDSSASERSTSYRRYDCAPAQTQHSSPSSLTANERQHNRVSGHLYFPPPPPVAFASHDRGASPEYGGASSRNYIEVFRDGDTKPSEVYSLPINEPLASATRPSRYDQYKTEEYSRARARSPPNLSPAGNTRADKYVPSIADHHPSHPSTSPTRDSADLDGYTRPTKSYDYRPLRTRLQREYKITPSLLVDEWDHPQSSTRAEFGKSATTPATDDVFAKKSPIRKA